MGADARSFALAIGLTEQADLKKIMQLVKGKSAHYINKKIKNSTGMAGFGTRRTMIMRYVWMKMSEK
jgi:hypothetical protein